MDLLPEELLDAYRKMKRIRVFEEKLNDLAIDQTLVIGEVRERKRASLFTCELVELGIAVAVGGEDVFGVEPLTF